MGIYLDAWVEDGKLWISGGFTGEPVPPRRKVIYFYYFPSGEDRIMHKEVRWFASSWSYYIKTDIKYGIWDACLDVFGPVPTSNSLIDTKCIRFRVV